MNAMERDLDKRVVALEKRYDHVQQQMGELSTVTLDLTCNLDRLALAVEKIAAYMRGRS